MFKQIKTSKENKLIVSELTRKLNLGPENNIARIAFTFSLSKNRRLSLKDVKDSGGKEYSSRVLFGDNIKFYIGLLCIHYSINPTNLDIPKYVKLHIDDGLELINKELISSKNIDGYDFLIQLVENGLQQLAN